LCLLLTESRLLCADAALIKLRLSEPELPRPYMIRCGVPGLFVLFTPPLALSCGLAYLAQLQVLRHTYNPCAVSHKRRCAFPLASLVSKTTPSASSSSSSSSSSFFPSPSTPSSSSSSSSRLFAIYRELSRDCFADAGGNGRRARARRAGVLCVGTVGVER
jgi:hypothetical protein